MNNHTTLNSRLLLVSLVTGVAAISTSVSGQVICEDIKLLAEDGQPGDNLGYGIDLENNLVVVGSRFDDTNGIDSGSAYIFDAITGVQLLKLLADDGAAGDQFGSSVAIQNGIVAVGAWGDDDNGSDAGSVYLFNPQNGLQLAKLIAGDGASGDHFGQSVALDNDYVAVASRLDDDNGSGSGSAYLFDATTGEQLFKLLPSDGAANDLFGVVIAVEGGVVAVGAAGDDDNGSNSGSAYIFEASTGNQIFKLLPDDGSSGDTFGDAIAIHSGIVAIGARFDDDNGIDSGSAYLFDATTGNQIAKLLPLDGEANDLFSHVIAIENEVVAVGSIYARGNKIGSGSAYLFDTTTGLQIAKMLPQDGAGGDQFGQSIAIDNGFVSVGALFDGDNGADSGSAYIFTVPNIADCRADLTNDGSLDFFDVSAFLQAFSSQDSVADFTCDGILDFFDVSAFLVAFTAGCP